MGCRVLGPTLYIMLIIKWIWKKMYFCEETFWTTVIPMDKNILSKDYRWVIGLPPTHDKYFHSGAKYLIFGT